MTRPIVDVAREFFSEDDWAVEEVKGVPAFRVRFAGSEEEWTCLAIAREEQRQFVFYAALDGFVPAPDRAKVAEYLTRANWGMAVGNWEMDLTTGEVRYKTSVDPGEEELTPALVKRAVYANIGMVERYLPGLRDVAAGRLLPAPALQRAEEPGSVRERRGNAVGPSGKTRPDKTGR